MYKLEDRILFDGAAVADAVDAQQEAEAQQQAAQEAAEAEEAAAQEASDNSANGEADSPENNDPGSLDEVLAAVNAGSLGSDGQRIDVLLVSDSLENADDLSNTANTDTIVVRYDARTTSAADLLQQISDALGGNAADSIAFATESGETAAIQLFADTDTSLDTVNDSTHQNFFAGLDSMLDEGGRVNLFASNLASSADGEALVDAIGEAVGHDVSASIDETGSESAGGDWDLEYSTDGNETNAADTYLDENLVENFDSLIENNISHEVAFINSSVMGNESLVEILELRGVEIVNIENGRGLSQINDYLNAHSDTKYDAVHIITHGNEGYFLVGSDNINNESLSEYYAEDITAWGNSLADDADIMIYGCNLTANSDGMNLVDTLANLTGADVAASNDDTGSRGDWELEYSTGKIETATLAAHDYLYTLVNRQVNTVDDEPLDSIGDGVMTLRKAITDSEDGDSITFASLDVLGTNIFTLASSADSKGYGQLEITSQISIDGTITITGGYLRATVTNEVADDFRLLYIAETAGSSESNVDIYNMVFTGGEAEIRADINYVGEGNGGGIYNAGYATFRDVDVDNSSSAIDGGGIYVASSGYLEVVNDAGGTLYNSSIYLNEAGTSGGGIFNNSGTISLTGSGGYVYIYSNTAEGSGGGIYSVGDVTAQTTNIYSNSVSGDGGGIFITNGDSLSSFTSTNIYSNISAGDGGGLYFFQGQDLHINSSAIYSNTASGDGGGIYINESRYLRDVSSTISNNTAAGDGGGVYLIESGNFYHERGYVNDNTAGGSGGAIYMTKSGYGVSGGYLSDLYLYAMDISGNTTNSANTSGNGTIYYDGIRKTGVDGAGSTISYMTAIDSNTVEAGGTGGSGGAIYQLDGDLSVWSSTLAFNTVDDKGGAIYFTGDNLDVQFGTLAYNVAAADSGSAIYIGNTPDTFTVKNTIIYDDTAVTGEALQNQIVTDGTLSTTTSTFNNNIYTNYSEDADNDTQIATIVQAGSGNIVNNDTSVAPGTNNEAQSRADIQTSLYLDTAMRNYSNYYARVIPVLVDYNQAITEGDFGWRNIAWQAGTTDYDSSIVYDTRGNTRTGYQYDKTTNSYVQNDAPSIGAFEAIFTITVNSKDDNGTSIFFDNALTGGITLREAVYWMDSYDAITYATDSSNDGALYNKERYVQFDEDVFASGTDNTITLAGSDISVSKSIIIGMTPWLNDQLKEFTNVSTTPGESRDNDINFDENGDATTDMTAWGGFRAQDSVGRITVSGNNASHVFDTLSSNSTDGTRRIYLNNLTITEGYAAYTSSDNYGSGGAIYNNTNLYLSNIAVTGSEANNSGSGYQDNAGWGGGIFSSGNLTLVETTVSGNTAIGYSSSSDGATKAGLGGGIYSTGTLEVYSSSIHDNTAQGSAYVSDEAAMGGGIYFDGNSDYLTVANTTISNNTNDANYTGTGDLHGQGSGLYIESGDVGLYYTTVIMNTAIRNDAEVTVGSAAAITSALDYDTSTDTLTIWDSIIANNDYSNKGADPNTRDLFDLYVVVDDPAVTPATLDIAYNIIGWTTGLTINEADEATNNQYNIIGDATFGKVANLNLEETLAYNGGKTKSHKLLDNSVAYQNGVELTGADFVTIDQRGADRIYAGSDTTIGAYQPLQYIVVTSTDDTNSASDVGFDFTNNSGGWMKADLELREAFTLADIYTQVIIGDTIGDTDPTVTLNQESGFGELVADIGFVLDGRSYAFTTAYSDAAAANTIITQGSQDTSISQLVVDGSETSRLIHITDSTPTTINLTVSYITLQNGNSSTQGGAIYNWENLTLDHVSVLDSTSTLQGGGIYSQLGSLTITDSTIQGNTAGTQGGGLYYESNNLSITRSSFLENTSTTSGGGIYAVGAQASIFSSTVGDNTSGKHGGGIYSDSSDIFVINSTIANNSADESGGGINFTGGGYLRMGYVTIANNISGADATSVNKEGGGLYQSAGTLNIYNSILAQNYQTSTSGDLNDIFLGTAVSFTQAEVQNNVLGVYTNNSATTINTGTNRVYSSGTGLYGGLVLNIDTVLSDNGGTTKTIYVSDLDTATINYGADLYYTYTAGTNTYALSLTSGTTQITTDQRGETRTSGSITVGAYQKNSGDYDYIFDNDATDGDYNNYLNWTLNGSRLTSESQLDFTLADTRYYIAADLSTAASTATSDTWTVNWRSQLIVNDTYTLTVAAGDTLNARVYVRGAMSVADTGTLQVRNYSSIDDSGTGELSVSGSVSTVSTTLSSESRLELLNSAALTLATLSYSSLNLVNSSTSSTVSYTYDDSGETQQLLDAKDTSGASTAYGNLILSGASPKTFTSNLSVQTLEFTSGTSLDVDGNLSIADATSGGSVSGSSITVGGDLTLGTGVSTSFNNTAFTFDGSSAQAITLAGNSTFGGITVNNSDGVSFDDSSSGYTLTAGSFTFTDGAFELQNSASLYLADGGSVTGADGDSGNYFITSGTGTVSLPTSSSGTNFVLAVEDASNPGTYKWVDTLISSTAATGRAAIRISDGITPAPTNAGDVNSSITVTWNIDTSSTEFTFALADYSDNAAGEYFDPSFDSLHYYSTQWDNLSSWTTSSNGAFYVGHGYSEVWLNADEIGTAGTLRYALANLGGAGVIVFSATHAGSDFLNADADIVLNSVLQVGDGVNVSIVGLDNGYASYVTGATGEQTLVIGASGGSTGNVNLKNLDLRGNGDYVLVNSENLTLSNISVAGIASGNTWTTGTISNTGTLAVVADKYLQLDGSATGNAFTYNSGSTLQYTLSPSGTSNSITLDDNSAEFGSSIQGLTVDSGVTLTLSDRTTAYAVNGNTSISGNLTIADDVTLSLGGASNDLGTVASFTAGTGSTVDYNRAGAQTVDALDYVNLTISGSDTKTVSDSFDMSGNLAVGSGATLAMDFATAETVTIDGDTAVSGTLAFSGAGAGTLELYGTNNDLGTLTYHTSTVSYLGATGQEISGGDYYNLIIGGGTSGTSVTKSAVTSDITTANDFTINDYTTFQLAAATLLVEGDFAMSSTSGAFTFTDEGTLRLEGTTTAAFNFVDDLGTVIYQGGSTQVVAGGTYNNLQIANGDKVLGGSVLVRDTFHFVNSDGTVADAGKLSLGTYDLYLNGDMTGYSGSNGRYLANTVTSSSGELYLLLAAAETKSIAIGTASNWAELTFTGGSTQQYVSVWTYDGVTTNGQPGGTEIANPEYAVNMTFNITPVSAGSYSMDFVDSSAKGASFDSGLATSYYYSSSESDWTQVSNPLSQTGPFFFGMGVPDGGLVVTNTNNSGSGSLRSAIAAANALSGVNLITFSKDVFYSQETITLTSGELSITDDVIIQGLGATIITVSGNDSSRIFNISAGISAELSGITVRDGYSTTHGGAIYVAGKLRMENVEVRDSVSDTVGDAVYILGTGELYTMNTTISSAEDSPVVSLGQVSMFNTTVTSPDTYAIYLMGGENLLFNATVSGNIDIASGSTATLTLNNSLIYGEVTGKSYSDPYSSNVVSTTSYFVNGNLEDNGGWVRTIAISNDSTVVDAGTGYSNGAYRHDARGYLVNDTNDIGAYEYNGYVARNTTTSTYYSSLSSAVSAAGSADTIELISSRILVDSQITLSSDITLEGAGMWDTALSAGVSGEGTDRLFTIGDSNGGPAVHMLDLSLRGGNVTGSGGAIYNYGNLHLHNVMLAGNAASVNGGAIYNDTGAFVYGERISIRGNTAASGAGAYNLGTLTLDASRIANNTASTDGGGIYNGVYGEQKGQLFLLNSTIDHNTATNGAGGGIYSTGTLQAEYSTIYANNAYSTASASGTGLGGGIYNIGDSRLVNLTIANNYAAIDGGGIYASTGAVNLVNSIAVYNRDVSGWDDISDTSSVITKQSNFIGTDYGTSFYSDSNNLFTTSLSDNGGWTYTLALNSSNSYYYNVVSQGIEVGINYDQRGYMINGSRDLGAYEVNGYIGYYLIDDNYRTYFSSIATALLAQSDKSSRTLYLLDTRIKEADINANLRYYSSSDEKYLPQTVTIKGAASGETVISAGGTGRVFYTNATVDSGGELILSRLTIADGMNIAVSSPLTTAGSTDGYGGAIYNNGAKLTLNNVNVINSQAGIDGGAIYNGMAANVPSGDSTADIYGTLTVSNSYFGNNFAGQNGGAIDGAGSAEITVSTIYGNTAGVGGGGIAITGTKDVSLEDSTVAYNRAFSGLGGGVYLASSEGAATFTSGKNLLARNYNGLGFERDGTMSTVQLDNGSGEPTPAATDNAGDLYLDGSNGDWYSYDGAAWTLEYNIITQYPASILTGTEAPSEETGSNGNYYVNTSVGTVYWKDSGTWYSAYSLGNTVHSGTSDPTGSTGETGQFYVNTTSGELFKKDADADWISQYDMNGDPQMYSGSGEPELTTGTGGDYYVDTDTGNLYIRAIVADGATGAWSNEIVGLKTANSVTYAMDYYYSAGKFSDGTYNLVEYQNGTWSADTTTFFGEITYDDEGEEKTNMHDVLGSKEKIFVQGTVTDDNGGWTYTLALADDGAATDTGTGSASDQRGYNVNSTADIGAYEYRGFVATVSDIGYDSIQNAINAAGTDETVTINATRVLETNINPQSSITISGTAAESYISAGYSGRVFEVEASDTTLTLNNLMIGEGVALKSNATSGAGAVGNGGAIFTGGSLSMTDVQMYNSFAERSGGAAYSVGDLTVNSTGNFDFPTLFSDNRANVSGGALSSSGTLNIKGSQYAGILSKDLHYLVQFMDNSTGGSGGAISASGDVTMQYFYIAHNHAFNGGGISLSGSGDAVIEDFSIDYNFASSHGGAIYATTYGNLEIKDNLDAGDTEWESYIRYNRSLQSGGAIYYTDSGDLSLTGLTGNPLTGIYVHYNNAGSDGGGIYVSNSGDLTLDYYVRVNSNTAANDGGGIYFTDSNDFSMVFADAVSSNTAANDGGGIYVSNSTSITTNDSADINSNSATAGSGGGIYIANVPTVSINYTQAGNNRAGVNGGFMYIANTASTADGDISITDLDAYNNSTDRTDLTVNSVSISGDWAFVGVADPNTSVTTDPGQVSIYKLTAGAWSLFQTIEGAEANDYFGYSVSVDGTSAIIGAYKANEDKGTVHIYEYNGTTWAEDTTITAPGTGIYFGYSVAISGTQALIGSPGENNGGAAYLYTNSGSSWSLEETFTGPTGSLDFGRDVAISGVHLIISDPFWYNTSTEYLGAAYLYTNDGSNWSLSDTFNGRSGLSYFGMSVDISSDKAVIGAYGENSLLGEVTFYSYDGSNWALDQTIAGGSDGYYFGESVAISGNKAVIGTSWGDSFRGAAYMYEYSASSWNLEKTFSGDYDGLGNLVAIDGDNAIINSETGSNVKFYSDTSGTWTFVETENMFTTEGKGGAIYIENGNDSAITVSRSGFDGNIAAQGSGLWVDHASSLSVTNSTFGSNDGGSALYMGYGGLSINFATFAHNTSTGSSSPTSIEFAANQASNFSLTNSIIYDDSASVISLGSSTTVTSSSRNLFLDVSGFSGPALYNSSYSTITAYGTTTSAGVLDSNRNIVGYNTSTTSFVSTYSYLASEMAYHANYRTRALAITSAESLAYQYVQNGNTVRPGNNSAGLTTDQRGNTRTGYTYNTETSTYELNDAPSIGAFEPMFYITVNDKGDMTYDPFGTIIQSGPAANAWFADAIAQDSSINLREASYWIDGYNPSADQFDANRYVKFDSSVFTSDGDNTITLTSGVGTIEIYTSQMISIVPGYNGQDFVADDSYIAQNDSSRITIDAGGNDTRVFSILDTKNADIYVALSNLNITGGATVHYAKDPDPGRGGGIYNNTNLTLNNVVVTGNSASNSSLRPSQYGLGGGIYNTASGVLTINDSTISDNTATGTKIDDNTYDAGLGGGIYNAGGYVTVNRSLITGNTASGFTVDPAEDTTTLAGIGGGIFSSNGNMILNNNTITANVLGASSRNTGSAIYIENGNFTASHNTIIENSLPTASLGSDYSATAGAIYIKGTGNAVLYSNIFANNNANGTSGFRGRDIYTASTINVTESNNIVGYYLGSHDFSTGSGNITGDSFGNVANLNLDSTLRYNGGKTMNFRVLSGSVAIGAGTTVTSSTDYDQRGYQRELGSSSTIGSYEMTTSITLVTNDETTVDYSNPSIGFDFTNNRAGWEASLRNAAYLADNGATITIRPSDHQDDDGNYDVWTRTDGVIDPIYVQNQAIRIVNGVSIVTYNDQIITIDGGATWEDGTATGGVRLFWINSLSSGLVDVSMTNLILQNANSLTDTSNMNGGAIYNSENLTLSNVQVINNQGQSGGGIYSTQGSLTLDISTLVDSNKATDGGGIYVDAGNITLTGRLNGENYEFVQVSNNTATGSGGAIYGQNATLNMTLADISDNTTETHGGGIYLINSALTMAQSQVTGNTATYDGGGLYQNGGTTSIATSTFSGNTASRYGGGLRISSQTFEMVNSTVAENSSGAYGGGLYLTGSGSHDLTFVTIAYNTSGTAANATQTAGGGIFINGGNLTMTNTVIVNNYHVSVSDSNRDEFYTTSASLIASATYNAIGTSSVAGSSLYFENISATNITNTSYTDFYSNLLIDSTLGNNGGATKTIYVWNNSLLVGSGVYLADVTSSQNGKDRANPPTIGAYENNPASATYYYISGDVNDISSWNSEADGSGDAPISFSIVDSLFKFDSGDAAVLAAGIWTIGSRSTIEIESGASFTINGTGSIATNPITSGETQTNFTASGTGSLNIGVADAAFYTPVSLTVANTSSTEYSYAGNQTVYSKTYGNLTISGSGTKTAAGAITVSGDLTLNSASSTLQTSSALTVTGATSGTGNISSTSTATFDGTVDLTGSTVSAATATFNDVVTVNNSTISGTTQLNVNDNIVAEGGTTSTLSSADFNFDESKSITVSDASTQLTFDVGSQDVNYYGNGGSAGSDFNIDVRNVTVDNATGSFEVSTDGNININGINGTDDSNVAGTLVFTGDTISIANGVDFNTAGVELNNSSTMSIGGLFEVQQSLSITGPVTLTSNATLTSVTGDLGLTGTVTGAGNDLTMNGNNVATGTFNNIGALDINASTVSISKDINATSVDVTGDATLSGSPTVTSSGAITFNDGISLASGADAKLTGDTITASDTISGSGNLTLEGTGTADNNLALVNMTGNLTLLDGTFVANDAISTADLNVTSPAALSMGTNSLTAAGNIVNTGTLSSSSTISATGNLTNSGSFTGTTSTTVGGNLTNSGTTFTTGTLNASGNITNTGTMTVTTLNLNDTSNTSQLSLGGTVNITSLNVADNKSANLTSGNLEVTNFTFAGTDDSDSVFSLASGTSLEATTITYNADGTYYDGNYFNVSDGGKLIRTMDNSDVLYRLGNSDSATLITLNTGLTGVGERISVGFIYGVTFNGDTVTGIQDTVGFTTVITRNIEGTNFTTDIDVALDWNTDLEGRDFTPPVAELYTYSGGWSPDEDIIVTFGVPATGRRSASYTLPHNGTYTIANTGADMTTPPNPANVNIYEQANPHFMTMSEDFSTNIFLPFEIGVYPYFTSDGWADPENFSSVGKAVYKQMEYRQTINPETNPLYGQVPAVGEVLGQAITEQANLTLTADAPIYLEVNGEYSVGSEWLPVTESASVENIEQYQEPITQGQIDEFYLDFGGREDIFEKATPFKSDLDEMLDDLLAG